MKIKVEVYPAGGMSLTGNPIALGIFQVTGRKVKAGVHGWRFEDEDVRREMPRRAQNFMRAWFAPAAQIAIGKHMPGIVRWWYLRPFTMELEAGDDPR